MSIPLLIPKAHASKQYDGSSICDYSMARLVFLIFSEDIEVEH